MKTTINYLFAIICISALLISCEKEGGSKNGIVGEWMYIGNELFIDGKSFATNIESLSFEPEDTYGYLHFNSTHLFPPINLTFTKDGYVLAMGMNIGTYTYSNGIIKMLNGYTATIKNGILTSISVNETYHTPTYIQIDYEENKTIKVSNVKLIETYKKMK